jgi:hypothetical protein
MTQQSWFWAHLHQLQSDPDPQAAISTWISKAVGKFTGIACEFFNYHGHSGHSSLFHSDSPLANGLLPLEHLTLEAAANDLEVWLQWPVGWIDSGYDDIILSSLRSSIDGPWNMATHSDPDCSGDGSDWFRLYLPEVRDFHLSVIEDLFLYNVDLIPHWHGIIADGIRYKWSHKDCPYISLNDTTDIVTRLKAACATHGLQTAAWTSHDQLANTNQMRRADLWLADDLIDYVALGGYSDPVAEKEAWIQEHFPFDLQSQILVGIPTEHVETEDTAEQIFGWNALGRMGNHYPFSYPRCTDEQLALFPDLIPDPPDPDPDPDPTPRRFAVNLTITGTIEEIL